MWQRIQTIFLFLAIAGLLAFLLVPTGMLGDTLLLTRDTVLRSALAIAGILLSAYSILTYKYRMRQIMVNWIAICSVLVIYVIWLLDPQRLDSGYQVLWGMYTPGFSIIFLLLANWRIKKDQKLIDSMDRLR